MTYSPAAGYARRCSFLPQYFDESISRLKEGGLDTEVDEKEAAQMAGRGLVRNRVGGVSGI